MKNFLSVIRASKLFFGIEDDEITPMLNCLNAKTKTFPKDAFILRIGDAVESIGLVLAGSAIIMQEDVWGNRNIISKTKQGQTFAAAYACAPNSRADVNVLAETEVAVTFFNVKHILNVCSSSCPRHYRIIKNLLAELAEKNLRFAEKLTHIGQRTTRAKLISYLSAEAQKHGNCEFDIPFSRQQLADYLMVERSGLSVELGKLRNDGLIEFNKQHFVLKT